ncbi:reverse transcriptase domain-containing protein [Tanacetum coccineum]
MWSSTRTVAPTPSSAIIQRPISDNFRIKEEAVMLRTFPFSLSGESKTWLNEFNEGTFTSWNEMREAFIRRYFSPPKFKRLLNDIHSFHQLGNETLVEAWIRLKEMLRACYGHGLTRGTIIQMFYHGLDGPTQGILDAGGIFLYNTPNEAFQILEDKVLLKLDFSGEFQISPKTVVSAGGSNIDSYHAMLMEKFEDLVTKIDSEFLIIRKELKEMRDGRSRNRQVIIQNLERQFEHLMKIQPSKSLPRTTNTKPRHEFVYKPPSIQNVDNKRDVKFIEVDETQPVSTMPNPNPIKANSPTVSPFPKDCTVHIPCTDAKTFADVVLLNHVGKKELKSIVGDGIGVKNLMKRIMSKDITEDITTMNP